MKFLTNTILIDIIKLITDDDIYLLSIMNKKFNRLCKDENLWKENLLYAYNSDNLMDVYYKSKICYVLNVIIEGSESVLGCYSTIDRAINNAYSNYYMIWIYDEDYTNYDYKFFIDNISNLGYVILENDSQEGKHNIKYSVKRFIIDSHSF